LVVSLILITLKIERWSYFFNNLKSQVIYEVRNEIIVKIQVLGQAEDFVRNL
jgi:hypothetical protein